MSLTVVHDIVLKLFRKLTVGPELFPIDRTNLVYFPSFSFQLFQPYKSQYVIPRVRKRNKYHNYQLVTKNIPTLLKIL